LCDPDDRRAAGARHDAGAALVFMVAGAVTSVPAAIAVFALVRRPVFLRYLALALVGSIAAGYGYQGWLAA
jgi:uncharacterized protein